MANALGALIVGGASVLGLGSWIVMLTLGFIYSEFGLLQPLGYPMSAALFVLIVGLRAFFGVSVQGDN